MGPSQQILVALAGGTDELHALAQKVGTNSDQVVIAVQRMKRRGLVEIVGRGRYKVTDAGRAFLASGQRITSGQAATRPRQQTRGMRQRAWWVLRARQTVSIRDLLTALADGTEKNAETNLARYLRTLARAGFLVELPRVPGTLLTSPGFKRYRLVRNNGRQAPVVRQHQRTVFDPNTGEAFPFDPTEDERS